jgi:hypothetical protein
LIVLYEDESLPSARFVKEESEYYDLQEWIDRTPEHAFSLAIRVVDKSKNKERSLYDELQAVNNLEVFTNNIVDVDLDLEAEA